ncbi:MAG: MazG nucleotide pyrophosphohydrolase domain-containing protein [Acidimicrobiales bacterium]
MRPRIRVVGLGPGAPAAVTVGALERLAQASVARLRTRRHPSAEGFDDLASYDDWYERADSFESLYHAIVDDLVELARGAPGAEVVYAVPGSPLVAERTVELLRVREDVEVVVEPAVSVIDAACAALGVDPMAVGLRVVDALSPPAWREGPHLVLQCYAPEVLAVLADQLAGASVTLLSHLGLDDERVVPIDVGDLARVPALDHLCSLWVEVPRGAAEATGDLVALVHRLRAECPWDQEQTHASLARHLLEEAYEALDALEDYVRADDADATAHLVEELGDLWCQVVFHAELAAEEERFDLARIADQLSAKLVARHPHVFGDVTADSADEVAARWEELKRAEKGRASVIDGVLWQRPALSLYATLLRKAASLGLEPAAPERLRDDARAALAALELDPAPANDAAGDTLAPRAWGDALVALVALARHAGVDLEGVVRERARALGEAIVEHERRD